MATRSCIIVKRRDGKYSGVYCHWDGYPSNQLPYLIGHYADQDIVEKLVSMGGISSLDQSLDKPAGHTLDSPVAGYCVFYLRDRGDINDLSYPRVADSPDEIVSFFMGIEYVYLFENGVWTWT